MKFLNVANSEKLANVITLVGKEAAQRPGQAAGAELARRDCLPMTWLARHAYRALRSSGQLHPNVGQPMAFITRIQVP